MTGTDTPIGFLIPGKSLHRELELFVKTGFSTKEALQAATINPASFLGLEHELGRVKEGYRADLLILDANPLDDIKNTQKSHALVKEGRLYSKEELNAMLNLE
jgi:imidazolonepropionase-like amidohydrolase